MRKSSLKLVTETLRQAILLDKALNPKISDFGLAKLFPSNVTHISTRVAGTLGYLSLSMRYEAS